MEILLAAYILVFESVTAILIVLDRLPIGLVTLDRC
jgi:hypothetical protein